MRLVTGEKGVHSPSLCHTIAPHKVALCLAVLCPNFLCFAAPCSALASLSLPCPCPSFPSFLAHQLLSENEQALSSSLQWYPIRGPSIQVNLEGKHWSVRNPQIEQFLPYPQAVALPRSWQSAMRQLRCCFECTRYLWTPEMATRPNLMTIIFPL